MESINIQDAIKLYIDSMTALEKEGYIIAQTQLESSFDIEKSIGFIDFINKNNYIIDKN